MTKKFIPLAKKVIDLEIQALQKLKKKIDNSFNKAVVEIAKCKSKVILCGVGKSGLIAAKISATLSSVGTPSFNLSASDSSHGDLGSTTTMNTRQSNFITQHRAHAPSQCLAPTYRMRSKQTFRQLGRMDPTVGIKPTAPATHISTFTI